jgi:hypothetical protein
VNLPRALRAALWTLACGGCLLPEAVFSEPEEQRPLQGDPSNGSPAAGGAGASAPSRDPAPAMTPPRVEPTTGEATLPAEVLAPPRDSMQAAADASASPTACTGSAPANPCDAGPPLERGGTGQSCNTATDCQSAVCSPDGCPAAVASCCQAPSCTDGVRNGAEPQIDCGNGACGLCPVGNFCAADSECQTGFCQNQSCADPGSCADGLLNGRETSIDCGGGNCPRCPDRLACSQASDCVNNNCLDDVCISCGDGFVDGTETDLDCGGADPFCARCNPGQHCLIGSDCLTGFCSAGFC